MSRNIAIGDVHGCVKTLRFLIEEKVCPTKSDKLFFMGDYVNKGPDSKGVMDYLLQLKRSELDVTFLRGNHDQLMINAWREKDSFNEFLDRGGESTMQSFNSKDLMEIPSTYFSFLATTEFFKELGSYILIHAGFDFQDEDIFPDFDTMLNIREMEVDTNKTGGKRIVHGHVPISLEDLKQIVHTDWKEISIDTGCVYVDRPGNGYLTAMILETHELIYTRNRDNS